VINPTSEVELRFANEDGSVDIAKGFLTSVAGESGLVETAYYRATFIGPIKHVASNMELDSPTWSKDLVPRIKICLSSNNA